MADRLPSKNAESLRLDGYTDAQFSLVRAVVDAAMRDVVPELCKTGGIWCSSIIEEIGSIIHTEPQRNELLESRANSLMHFAWEMLHLGYWKDVPMVWRDTYSIGAIVLAYSTAETDQQGALRALDLGILMGSPNFANKIQLMIDSVCSARDRSSTEGNTKKRDRESDFADLPSGDSSKKRKLALREPNYTNYLQLDPICGIQILESPPSLTTFYREYFLKQRPVIIRQFVSQWPAIADPTRRWDDLQYLKRVAGFRTVPIEIGSKYTESQWSQTLMSLEDFIDFFITKSRDPPQPAWKDQLGYLAQTQLFEQIVPLKRDIIEPDYTSLVEHAVGEDDGSSTKPHKVNAWFGPGGTVSPLHQDPDHNLFCQVVGEKYIRLYDSAYRDEVYPFKREESVLDNTSQVDVEAPDLVKFPLFASAKYQECVLRPGEMLYVPPKWWHYIRSLSTSFSVSFWW